MERRSKGLWIFGFPTLAVLGCCVPLPGAAQEFAYVTSLDFKGHGSVCVIDTAQHATIASIPVGLGPFDITTSPAGDLVYVLDANSKAIDVIDAKTRAITASVKLPQPDRISPTDFAITRDGFAYFTNRDNGFLLPGTIFVFDLANSNVAAKILFDRATGVALSPDGTRLYADGTDGIAVIDTATNAVITTVPAYTSSKLVVSPDGQFVYATGCFVPGNPGVGVCIIDTSANTVTDRVLLADENAQTNGITLSPDGRYIYAPYQGSGERGTLAVIDTAARTVRANIPVGNSPFGVAATPDGREVYVANLASDTVSVIDTATNALAVTIPVCPRPAAIAIAPWPTGAPLDTPTRRPTPTPTAIPTPVPGTTAVIEVSSASVHQGDELTVSITLHTAGADIAGVQNDISFPSAARIVACAVNPDINKDLSAFRFSDSGIRAIVVGNNVAPIPDDSVLYTCTVQIGWDAIPEAHYFLFNSHLSAADPYGNLVTVSGRSGDLLVLGRPTRTWTPTLTPTHTPTPSPRPACHPDSTAQRATAYVANFASNTISVIDTACSQVTATIQLPAGTGPLAVALAPDGRTVYVSPLTSDALPQIIVIDTASNVVTATIALDARPDPSVYMVHDIAAAPDGRSVYVTDAAASVAVIDAATQMVTTHVPLTGIPNRIAISADGRFAYVTYQATYYPERLGGVDVIDIDPNSSTANTLVATFTSSNFSPVGIALGPEGRLAYTTAAFSGHSSVLVFDTTDGAIVATLGVAPDAVAIVSGPDGRFVYVAHGSPDGRITVIDSTTNAVPASIAVNSPVNMAMTPDGQFLYAVNQFAGTVSAIDTATNSLAAVIPVGLVPNGIAIGVVPATPTPTAAFAIDAKAAQPGVDQNPTMGGGCASVPGPHAGGFAVLTWVVAAILLWPRNRR